jgi:hypothetical protein
MTLLTHKEVQDYLSIVDKVPAAERMKITALLEMDRVERCKESFLPFVKEMWPIFISGKHHQIRSFKALIWCFKIGYNKCLYELLRVT